MGFSSTKAKNYQKYINVYPCSALRYIKKILNVFNNSIYSHNFQEILLALAFKVSIKRISSLSAAALLKPICLVINALG